MVSYDETIVRCENCCDILHVSGEEQHLASCSRRKLGPGEEWAPRSGVGGDSCLLSWLRTLSSEAEVGRASGVSYEKTLFPVQESPSWAAPLSWYVGGDRYQPGRFVLRRFLGVVVTDPYHTFGCL